MPTIPLYKEEEGRIRWLSYEEERRILAKVSNPDLKLFYILLAETGMRLSEGFNLLWKDVEEDLIYIWGSGSKSKKTRSIPLSKRAKRALLTLQISGSNGKVLKGVSKSWTGMAFREAKKSAGFLEDDTISVHTLRHTCATRLVNGNVNVRVIQDWLGHSDIKTTLKYMHFNPEMKLRAVDALNEQLEFDEKMTKSDEFDKK